MTNDIIQLIEQFEELDISKSFEIAQYCSKSLRKHSGEVDARKIVVNVLNNWHKIPMETFAIWNDIIESVGFYPYINDADHKLFSTASEIRYNYHRVDCLDGIILHEEQQILRKILDSEKNVIVSAPTSFGKSLLIEYMVAKKKYSNIVIIQPTLALLDETRKKLKKYDKEYKIIVRTSQEPDKNRGNLFLLTAERVMEYQLFPEIDFFVIDEFYKFSSIRDDERSDVLNNACYKLMKQYNAKFYFLGPNIDGISNGFAEQYNAEFFKTEFSLIDNRIIDIYSKHKDKFCYVRKYKTYKENVLFDLLLELKNQQTIIYCSSPARVRELAYKFVKYLDGVEVEKSNELPLVEWINCNIHPEWQVVDFLNNYIGINDGALQKHINSSMIDYFNSGKLKYMFCTSTIIEGVNTSAKNVVIFDNKKGNIPIDYFDYSNIVGRSGRMMIHYIGNIYNFIKPPAKTDKMIVDIPFFQQNPIKDEVLINILDEDVLDKGTEQYQDLLEIPYDLRKLIGKNGVLVKGQLKILEEISNLYKEVVIERNHHRKQYVVKDLICWTGHPSYDQLYYVFMLCFNNLLKPTETVSPMTLNKLVYITFNYANHESLTRLIKDDYNYKYNNHGSNKESINTKELLNNSIRDIFNISRHWFKYKVPKWLSVMNELQAFVFKKNNLIPGNYIFFSNQIENEFLPPNMALFAEYGIPTSAIKKIARHIPPELTEDQVLMYMKGMDLKKISDMILYEEVKLKQLL